jgi:mono/diheme cytochrome c family protein
MTILLLLACASARRTEPVAGPMVLDAAAERGRRAFELQCHACHPEGEGGLAPAINNHALPGVAIRAQVRLGAGAMPAFGHDELSADDLDDIVAYLTAMRRRRPAPESVR